VLRKKEIYNTFSNVTELHSNWLLKVFNSILPESCNSLAHLNKEELGEDKEFYLCSMKSKGMQHRIREECSFFDGDLRVKSSAVWLITDFILYYAKVLMEKAGPWCSWKNFLCSSLSLIFATE
jgi:hypothetical protein